MASHVFVIIDGIDGQSTFKDKAIDILSFSWGAANSPASQMGGSELRAGRVSFSDLSIMKLADKASLDLMQSCATGKLLSKLTLYVDKPMGDKQEDYFKLTLENVLVTSYQVSSGMQEPSESVSFAFNKVTYSYNPEVKGKLAGFVDRGFDVAKLTKV
jgi:type VI secretion system secreted protein Hcp